MQQVEVVSIDRTLDPPSYGIRVDGNVRETEGHRLSAQRKLAAASVEITGVVGTGGMVGDDACDAAPRLSPMSSSVTTPPGD